MYNFVLTAIQFLLASLVYISLIYVHTGMNTKLTRSDYIVIMSQQRIQIYK